MGSAIYINFSKSNQSLTFWASTKRLLFIYLFTHLFNTACVRSTREGTVFTGVCLFTFRGEGGPHPRSRQGRGYPIQLTGGGGYPIPGPGRGYPIPSPGGGVPHPRSRWGYPWVKYYPIQSWMERYPIQSWMGYPPPTPSKTGWGIPLAKTEKINKKVLLHECKRHTARCQASAYYAGLSPNGGGGVTPSSPGWEDPVLTWKLGKTPPPVQTWDGVHPPPPRSVGWGTPSPSKTGWGIPLAKTEKINKKVLLHECKRHTARCIASAHYDGLSLNGAGGVTPSSPGWEGPVLTWELGNTPPPTPCRLGMGYTPSPRSVGWVPLSPPLPPRRGVD